MEEKPQKDLKKSTRIDIRVPNSLLVKIEEYQEAEDFQDRTKALLDLVKIGLKAKGK